MNFPFTALVLTLQAGFLVVSLLLLMLAVLLVVVLFSSIFLTFSTCREGAEDRNTLTEDQEHEEHEEEENTNLKETTLTKVGDSIKKNYLLCGSSIVSKKNL